MYLKGKTTTPKVYLVKLVKGQGQELRTVLLGSCANRREWLRSLLRDRGVGL